MCLPSKVSARRAVPLLLFLLMLVFLLAAGCGKPGSGQTGPTRPGPAASGGAGGAGSGGGTAPADYHIALIKDGKQLRQFTLSDIKALPAVTLEADGKTQQGPTLAGVLKAAGIDQFSSVKVSGAWKEEYSLTRDKVNDRVLLDISNRGTCKLAGPDIPKDKWVRDVITLEVK